MNLKILYIIFLTFIFFIFHNNFKTKLENKKKIQYTKYSTVYITHNCIIYYFLQGPYFYEFGLYLIKHSVEEGDLIGETIRYVFYRGHRRFLRNHRRFFKEATDVFLRNHRRFFKEATDVF